jgi:murein DD-endopeptidase MepM/ murein hydrolase activator NlpD
VIPAFAAPILNSAGQSYAISGWGEPRPYRGGIHNGLDFPAPIGVPVRAAASGVVIVAGDVGGPAGRMITIHHGGGWHTRYLHLDQIGVAKGASVSKNQTIGTSGASGIQQSAAHLHFDIRVSPSALQEFASKFGPLPPGGETTSVGVGVPAESLVPIDRYGLKVIARMAELGISRAKAGGAGGGWLIAAGLAVVLGLVVARYVR